MKNSDNPLGLIHVDKVDLYILPPQLCTLRRKEYFLRGNRIINTQFCLSAYSKVGYQFFENEVKKSPLGQETPVRITLGNKSNSTKIRVLLSSYNPSLGHLHNLTFTQIYGNIEAYILDLVMDALIAEGNPDPFQESISLLISSKWMGKIDRISTRFNIPLGKTLFINSMKGMKMELFGETLTDPIEFLQYIADLRHRFIHSLGRCDKLFLQTYPKANIKEGEVLQVGESVPLDFFFLLCPITDVFDDAFAKKYNLPRTIERPEKLLHDDLTGKKNI